MSDPRSPDVLGSLPRTRPHRRSQKRPERPPPTTDEPKRPPAARKPPRKPPRATSLRGKPRQPSELLTQPAQPAGAPRGSAAKAKKAPTAAPRPAAPRERPDLVATAVQAAAELAEIGLTVGARALRAAVSRLPRP